jgi:predicted nuclease with TOPRIM domain
MEDLKESIEMVRNALFIDEESEAFEKIIERLEGYEIAYNTILASNERLEKENKKLKDTVDKLKWR